MRVGLSALSWLVLWHPLSAAAPAQAIVRIEVRSGADTVAGAEVAVHGRTYITDANGVVSIDVPPGAVEIAVKKPGFVAITSSVFVEAGQTQAVVVELQARDELEEEVFVSATRTSTRVQDQPLRVEVVPAEEVQEKIMMTPGDVSMLLNETNGLRVQTTSPSLGAANVRVQGLRGRYTQILADGLPLYGGQTGSIGLLQIPPMDLGQVEVIKGVASALYGMSAIGGVVNLVSRRPPREREGELLVNRTSHAGTDVVNWLAGGINDRWSYTFLGGAHVQDRSDLDADGWTDLPRYRRVLARPRLFWENGGGTSLVLALGGMSEERRGGTLPGSVAPDGLPFEENLDTRRFDAGAVLRSITAGGRVFTIRGSATRQDHTHQFGTALERDGHRTAFGETSLMGSAGPHTWVAGGALEYNAYRSDDVPRFDYTYVVPGFFAQDDFTVTPRLTLAGSLRIDAHNEFGGFVSPRLSALVRTGTSWIVRLSAGRGHFAPTPFIEESEAIGLTPIAPLTGVRPEAADSLSADVTWSRGPLEITGTAFTSRIQHALTARESGRPDFPIEIVNADGPTLTRGTELIARYHRDDPELDVILTHMFLWSTEPEPLGPGRRDVALNPRQSATFDLLKQIGPARVGFEVFYTGQQVLDDNPYRDRGFPYVLFGGLIDFAIGASRVYVNVENLGDVRQTREDRLVRPSRTAGGRWTVDAWAPLEGRTLNAGIRWRF